MKSLSDTALIHTWVLLLTILQGTLLSSILATSNKESTDLQDCIYLCSRRQHFADDQSLGNTEGRAVNPNPAQWLTIRHCQCRAALWPFTIWNGFLAPGLQCSTQASKVLKPHCHMCGASIKMLLSCRHVGKALDNITVEVSQAGANTQYRWHSQLSLASFTVARVVILLVPNSWLILLELSVSLWCPQYHTTNILREWASWYTLCTQNMKRLKMWYTHILKKSTDFWEWLYTSRC